MEAEQSRSVHKDKTGPQANRAGASFSLHAAIQRAGARLNARRAQVVNLYNTSHNAYYVNTEVWVVHEAGLGPCRYPLTPVAQDIKENSALRTGCARPALSWPLKDP